MRRFSILAMAGLCGSVLAQPLSDEQSKFYADAAIKTERIYEQARSDARTAAQSYLQAAELRCRQRLADDHAYRDSTDRQKSAARVLDEARNLRNTQLVIDASGQLKQANDAVRQIEARVMDADPDVMAARAILDKIDPPQPKPLLTQAPAVAAATIGKSSRPAPKRKPTTIEIGMTRAELGAFLKANSLHFRVVRDSASRPESTVTIQTNTRGADATDGDAVSRTKTTRNKTEYVTIEVMQATVVPAGQHKDALGHWQNDTAVKLEPNGSIEVTLTDDVVSAVSGAIN